MRTVLICAFILTTIVVGAILAVFIHIYPHGREHAHDRKDRK